VCLFVFCVCESVDVGTLEKLATDQLVTTRWINSDGVMRKFFFLSAITKNDNSCHYDFLSLYCHCLYPFLYKCDHKIFVITRSIGQLDFVFLIKCSKKQMCNTMIATNITTCYCCQCYSCPPHSSGCRVNLF
jgi:hypothetical protein